MSAKRQRVAASDDTDVERRSSGESTASFHNTEEDGDALVNALTAEGLSTRQCQRVKNWYHAASYTDPFVVYLQDPLQSNVFALRSPSHDPLTDIRAIFGACPHIDVNLLIII
jgi:hypothetical protein